MDAACSSGGVRRSQKIVGLMRYDGTGGAVDAEPATTSTTVAGIVVLAAMSWATTMTTPTQRANSCPSVRLARSWRLARSCPGSWEAPLSRHGWRAMRLRR